MRRSPLLPVAAALVGALALGCGDQPAPAEPAGGPPRPTLRTVQNPDGPGAQVIRFDIFGIPLVDPDRGLTLTSGLPLSQVPECGGPGGPSAGTGQVVATPADVGHTVFRTRQQPLVLYGRAPENICELTEADIVASGRGNVTVMFSTLKPDVVFKGHVTGTLELTSGGRVHLVSQAVIRFQPDGTVRVIVDKFQLKPIGG